MSIDPSLIQPAISELPPYPVSTSLPAGIPASAAIPPMDKFERDPATVAETTTKTR
jgi:hypothetical protein